MLNEMEHIKHEMIVPVSILAAKFGICIGFVFLYSAAIKFFSSEYHGLVTGMLNTIGRLIAVAAPFVAEQDKPTPMIVIIILSILSIFASLGLTTGQSDKYQKVSSVY